MELDMDLYIDLDLDMKQFKRRGSIYPLSKQYREDKIFLRNMIEKDLKSIEKGEDNICLLNDSDAGSEIFEEMLNEDVSWWQEMEEAFSREASSSDDLSIDFMMDDYDRDYSEMINDRIAEIEKAAVKFFFLGIDKTTAQKLVDAMATVDCQIIIKNKNVFSSGSFAENWENYHKEKLDFNRNKRTRF